MAVAGSRAPVTGSVRFFWKTAIAEAVPLPKTPSAPPGRVTLRASSVCMRFTAAPRSPWTGRASPRAVAVRVSIVPVTSRRRVFWNDRIAEVVMTPKMPSAPPGRRTPAVMRACWARMTWAPRSPKRGTTPNDARPPGDGSAAVGC